MDTSLAAEVGSMRGAGMMTPKRARLWDSNGAVLELPEVDESSWPAELDISSIAAPGRRGRSCT